jgi:hypothetical protein
MARSLNIVIGADIEKLQKGFNDAVSVVQSSGKKMSEAAAETAKSIQDRLASIATKNPTAGTVRQLTNLAMEARALGPEFAAVANEIIKQAGNIKDSIGDARAEVGYFASDTRRLDALVGGIQGIAGAFSAVEGATALLEVENEDLQKTMVKLQGAIALVNGLQAIQNTLQAESAAMVGLQTAATRIQTFVLGQATVAARAYAAALVATGAGAIIAGLALIYNALQSNADAAEEAEAAQKKYTDALEAQNSRAIKWVESRLQQHEEIAKKEAQLAGKSQLQILKIEEEHLKKRLAAYRKMQADISIDSQLYFDLSEKIQAASDALTLKGLDIKIQASNQARAQREKDLAAELKAEQEAIAEQNRMRAEQAKFIEGFKPAQVLGEPATPSLKAFAAATKPLQQYTPVLKQTTEEQVKVISDYEQRMSEAANSINNAFNNLTAQGLQSFGDLIGNLMTGQINSFDDFGKALLGSVAQFMRAFGSALIATATASKAFKELLIKDPVLAAAAGVALVAGSAAISGMLKKGPQPTAFAEGGIVSGPTLGLVGEYPGASSNPEVIAPLDKLKGMLNTGDKNAGYVASTTISGRDLAIVLERYNKDSKRG